MNPSNRSDLIEELLESVHLLKRRILGCMNPIFEAKGITHTEWFTLAHIAEHQGTGIKDIAHALGITSSAATQVVNALFDKALVIRKDGTEDRRTTSIFPSETGATLLEMVQREHRDMFLSLFKGLSDEELRQYVTIQKRLLLSEKKPSHLSN